MDGRPVGEAKAEKVEQKVTRDGSNRLRDAGRRARKRAAGSATKERIAGKAMQWEGKATGDPIRETEGKALSAFGRMKGKVEKVRHSFRERIRRLRK
jgi:uncharacterized protein YjbJ (UPF0337 family)